MPRSFIQTEPKYINTTIEQGNATKLNVIEIATSNVNKIKEYQRLLPKMIVKGIKIDVEEIQSLDPLKVVETKAKDAFEKNGNNPILVEDTSLDLYGLGGRPGTLATFFISEVEMRRMICEDWLKNKDRRALARVIVAIYDGVEVHSFEGICEGSISKTLLGENSFGFDDMFIPKGQTKTFAQMGPAKKDKFSMRRKALNAFLESDLILNNNIIQLPEPFENELNRLQKNKINTNRKALKFAYSIEAVDGNKPNKEFEAPIYKPLTVENTAYYSRYKLNKDSNSIGMIITDIDKTTIELYQNGNPKLWQMGPEKRMLALAQRTEYFIKNTDTKILKAIKNLERSDFVKRTNKRSPSLETIMKYDFRGIPFNTKAVKELGYKKRSSDKQVSRREIAQYGLFNKIGKYPRLMYGIGSLPPVSGWNDVIVTAIIGHMPVFISRNNIFAGNPDLRIKLVKQVKRTLEDIGINKNDLHLYERNIGLAIGNSNPKEEVEEVRRYIKEAGVRLFRIYTINSDPRFIETATLLRKEFGNDIEIFAGQIADKRQAYKLRDLANIDGIMIGHGGGRQCTSATNGMALTTVEEIYSLVTDHNFNDISLVVEGGVGRSVGALAVLGVDAILYNQQLTRGTIETGGIFVKNNSGEFGQPYNGSASAPTMIIEAANETLTNSRLTASGRTLVPEGKKGFSLYSEKANSMAFWIDEFKHQMARTFADLGVENINELRSFINTYDKELLRIVSNAVAETSKAYKNN